VEKPLLVTALGQLDIWVLQGGRDWLLHGLGLGGGQKVFQHLEISKVVPPKSFGHSLVVGGLYVWAEVLYIADFSLQGGHRLMEKCHEEWSTWWSLGWQQFLSIFLYPHYLVFMRFCWLLNSNLKNFLNYQCLFWDLLCVPYICKQLECGRVSLKAGRVSLKHHQNPKFLWYFYGLESNL